MLEFTVTAISNSSVNAGCFWLLGRLVSQRAPEFGKAIKLLSLKPHFDDVNCTVPGGHEQLRHFQAELADLPRYTFSRANGNLTLEYVSKVCLGSDLLGKANIPKKHDLADNDSARLLEAFFKEMIETLDVLWEILKPNDDFDTTKFLDWLETRLDELPVDNLAVLELSQRQLDSARREHPKPEVDHAAHMTEDEFWSFVELIDRECMEQELQQDAVEPLIAELSTQTVERIYAFHYHLTNVLFALDTKAHCKAAPWPSDDGFLYSRCYVVGRGRRQYEKVLADPAQFPKSDVSLELLLSAAPLAWAEATEDASENFDHSCVDKSYESGSNRLGWGILPNTLYSICIGSTRESIHAMLEADRRQSASLTHDAAIFLNKLNELGFSASFEHFTVNLDPTLKHGEIQLPSDYEGARYLGVQGGFDAVRFVTFTQKERDLFYTDLAADALLKLFDSDKASKNKIEEARKYTKNKILKGTG